MRRRAGGRTAAVAALLVTLATAIALLVPSGDVAQARVVSIHGKGYGVTLTPSARAAVSPLFRGHARALTLGGPQPPVEYHEGPLMLSTTLYLIFWESKAGEFPAAYTQPIIQYAKDLEADDALTADEFSVVTRYTNAGEEAITGKVTVGGEELLTGYPPLDKAEGCTRSPCVSDRQIEEKILEVIKAKGWPTDLPGVPTAEYLMYTPPGVSNCVEGECSNEVFCAYHAQITKIGSEKRVATYADLPDAPECDSQQAPAGVGGDKDADGTLGSEIHELAESATDPEPESGYTDAAGEEIADKCAEFTNSHEIYGTPLGGSLAEDTAFNQLIHGHTYYTQQLWSQTPTQTPEPATNGEPAGCVARVGPTPSFTAPPSGATGHAISLDGSGSYDIAAPIATYAWNFGDGSPVDTSSGAQSRHYYLQPGTYQASLTVSDSAGAADASTQTVPITITGAPVGAPTASIESPANNQTYMPGQVVATRFSCQDAAGGPGVESCIDANGAASPGALDTSTVGPHSYTVTAVSDDGQRGVATIEYTVASPSGNPGGGNPGGSGNPGSGANNTGSPGAATGSTSSGTASASSGATSGTTTAGAGGHRKPLTNAQKLARAIKACGKLKKSKRASCIAAAKRRFGPKRGKRKGKPAGRQHALRLGVAELRHVLVDGPLVRW